MIPASSMLCFAPFVVIIYDSKGRVVLIWTIGWNKEAVC